MEVSRELIENITEVFNSVFDDEDNSFGIHHNLATDILSQLEQILLLEKK